MRSELDQGGGTQHFHQPRGELVYVPPKIPEGSNDDWSYGLDFTGLDVSGKIVIADGRSTKIGADEVTQLGGSRSLKIAQGSAVEVGEGGLPGGGQQSAEDHADHQQSCVRSAGIPEDI